MRQSSGRGDNTLARLPVGTDVTQVHENKVVAVLFIGFRCKLFSMDVTRSCFFGMGHSDSVPRAVKKSADNGPIPGMSSRSPREKHLLLAVATQCCETVCPGLNPFVFPRNAR